MDFQAALDAMHAACDQTFGEAATFLPASGASAACTVERAQPAAEFGLENAKAVVEDAVLRVLKQRLARAPRKGDLFEIAATKERFRVLAAATIEDDDGLRWTLKVERAQAGASS